MTKLIIQHLWSDFKKHWLGILVTLVLCYIATIFVFTFGFWFFMVDSEAYLLSEAELRKMILNGSETYTLLYFIGTAGIFVVCHPDFQKISRPAVETNLFLSGRYEIKKKIFTLLFREQGFFLSDFICITLSELYRKSADIFPDSRAYIATFFVLLYPD